MFCGKCGAAVPDGGQFCDRCGQPVAVGSVLQSGTYSSVNVVRAPFPDAPTSGKAMASMISGIFGLIFFLPAIAAIILGHMSRAEIRRSDGRLKGNGMATAGLVMGYGAFASIPLLLILAAIAIPNLLRARIAANESSAVSSIRTINTAERAYKTEFGDVGFACQLATLGGAPSSPSADHARLIDERLSSGEKSGYRFSLEYCANTDAGHKYQVIARPINRNQTGVRTFCSDESGIVKSSDSELVEECLANGSSF